MARLQAVLFDVDRTLMDGNDAHAKAWVQAIREQGTSIPYEKVRQLIGKGCSIVTRRPIPDNHLDRNCLIL
jgi:beta-phosphoglucomutase-like phosphatase (HAD superfamily)